MLLFRQMFDPVSSTYTYLLADGVAREAVIIDPVFEHVRRDGALVEELGFRLACTLETHVHADHVTGASLLKHRLGSRIVLSEMSGAQGADRYLKPGEGVTFGAHTLAVRATPGHTSGCITYVLDGGAMAFTGDCLLIRGCGRTDFQGGDAHVMWRSLHEQILTLPNECLLYPAHDYRGLTVTSVSEERAFNPRFGGTRSEGDFVGYMNALGLPHPKQIDIAVPANLKCGRPANYEAAMKDPDWAPLTLNFAGVWEIDPEHAQEAAAKVRFVDVREPDEFTGPLGHIKDSMLIPLGELSARTGEIPKDKPVVMVCRSGARSARATEMMTKAGFDRVANLKGGMLRWRAEKRAVEGGA
jgi:glyoxylase-like metal-dependent hydrolase (beta-lactamase superfamily II)/rhodanese-related sulfurtransferase